MNPQQEIALAHPCEFAEQCFRKRYKRYEKMGDEVFSTMLTVNVGKE